VTLLAVGAAALAATVGHAPTAEPHVLLIGDSVSTGMQWSDDSVAILQRGLALDWQVAVCRRLAGTSCPFDGADAPTLLDVVASLGHVPPCVVVEMGYNDRQETFAADVDKAMRALLAAGAKHVLWLTLREVRDPYPALDSVLSAAAVRYPQLELVDWNAFSGNHPEWFQSDGIHLDYGGGLAMAHLVHGSIVELYSPLHTTTRSLPELRKGRRYSARLRVAGGTAPYRWRIAAGAPPRGIHLLANGRLYGRPRSRAALDVSVQVTDADGLTFVSRVRARPAPS
jgi:hypothetical protein